MSSVSQKIDEMQLEVNEVNMAENSPRRTFFQRIKDKGLKCIREITECNTNLMQQSTTRKRRWSSPVMEKPYQRRKDKVATTQ